MPLRLVVSLFGHLCLVYQIYVVFVINFAMYDRIYINQFIVVKINFLGLIPLQKAFRYHWFEWLEAQIDRWIQIWRLKHSCRGDFQGYLLIKSFARYSFVEQILFHSFAKFKMLAQIVLLVQSLLQVVQHRPIDTRLRKLFLLFLWSVHSFQSVGLLLDQHSDRRFFLHWWLRVFR